MKLIDIKKESDVKKTIQEALDIADQLDSVVILGIKKDGCQYLMTSTMNTHEKAFLAAFYNAWLARWFKFESEQ